MTFRKIARCRETGIINASVVPSMLLQYLEIIRMAVSDLGNITLVHSRRTFQERSGAIFAAGSCGYFTAPKSDSVPKTPVEVGGCSRGRNYPHTASIWAQPVPIALGCSRGSQKDLVSPLDGTSVPMQRSSRRFRHTRLPTRSARRGVPRLL